MPYYPHRHHRHSIRLRGCDYGQVGAYFITICTQDRVCLFGDVVDGEMRLNGAGQIAQEEWLRSAIIRPRVTLDAFVVMPNHIHGIIVLDDGRRGTLQRAPTEGGPTTGERFGKPTSDSIPTIIRLFKAATTKRVNSMRDTPGMPVWQRNYYEHIVRTDESLDRIRQYIFDNPANWANDRENPEKGRR
jgi:REP-associated tyrosine transposase